MIKQRMHFAVPLVLCFTGCNKSENMSINAATPTASQVAPKTASQAAPRIDRIIEELGLPSDYFPTGVGRRWVYEIETFPGDDPLIHRVTTWPLAGNKQVAYESRGRLMRHGEKKGKPELILSVVGPAAEQGPLKYREGYELKVEKDDLGIYEDTAGIFWAISASGGYSVNEVAIYDSRSRGSFGSSPWGSYGREHGHALRVVFFGEKPGIAIGLSEENDSLLFVGPTTYDKVPCLHFRRMVDAKKGKPDDDGSSILDRAFTEDVWYGKGIGLMRLEQKIDNKTTMIWKLQRNKPTL